MYQAHTSCALNSLLGLCILKSNEISNPKTYMGGGGSLVLWPLYLELRQCVLEDLLSLHCKKRANRDSPISLTLSINCQGFPFFRTPVLNPEQIWLPLLVLGTKCDILFPRNRGLRRWEIAKIKGSFPYYNLFERFYYQETPTSDTSYSLL